jgi:hypothetical protein
LEVDVGVDVASGVARNRVFSGIIQVDAPKLSMTALPDMVLPLEALRAMPWNTLPPAVLPEIVLLFEDSKMMP